METDEPVIEGFLFLPPVGKILKKTWQKKYCVLHNKSSSGIARIEIFENETKTGQAKILTLEDVIKITPNSSNRINVVTKNSYMDFGTMSDDDMANWFAALKSVAFPEDVSSIEQDNDLYCSTDEGVFSVKLHQSDASQRCNLASKTYILVITSSALQLLNQDDNKLLYTWPFSYIRKYGYKSRRFTFEAGRKCASGEGVFYLEHPNHNEIYRCLSMRMQNMKKLLRGESTSSLIDNGDIQLQAALTMEAGSRNPLPPSISTQSSFSETSKASLTIPHTFSVPPEECLGMVKTVPKKPPRKTAPTQVSQTSKVTINANHEYTDVSQFEVGKYDNAESRTDTWKIMGFENTTHTDLVSPELEDAHCSWGNARREFGSEMKRTDKTSAPAVIREHTTALISQHSQVAQTPKVTINANHEYTDVSQFESGKYATVESRTDAWKTMGIENPSHSDLVSPELVDTYCSWGNKRRDFSSEMKKTEKTSAPAVIREHSMSSISQYYDCLQHFGSSSSLNVKSGYKKIIPQINKGIDNISHTDESLTNCGDEYASWCSTATLSKAVSEVKLTGETDAPTVISEQIQSNEEGYDHLNFFGQPSAPTDSLNYKQVISSSSTPPVQIAANLYEEVIVMESVRSADDSHLGYALIRKDSVSGKLKGVDEHESTTLPVEEEPTRVAHQFQNHQPYAVISKPKRV